MLVPLSQVLVALCSTSPFACCNSRGQCPTTAPTSAPHSVFQVVKARLCLPGIAASLTLGISRIVQLKHPARESGGMNEATTYNRPHPSFSPGSRSSGRCRHPQLTLQGRERRPDLLPHLSLLQLLLLLHLQFFGFKDDRKNQYHE